MKFIFAASFILNVVLAGIWLFTSTSSKAAPEKISADPTPIGAPVSAQPSGADAMHPLQKTWYQIENRSPAELMAKLRETGCPEDTIRTIVVMQICRAYRAEMLDHESRASRDWDYTKNPDAKTWKERNWQRREMREKMITEIESLTGESWAQVRNTLLGWPQGSVSIQDYCSREKRQQIRRTELQYGEELQELRTKALTAGWDSESQARFGSLHVEMEKAIAALLSPSEMEEYRFRESAAADYVRQNLPEAKNEQEFRAMVKVAAELGLVNEPTSMATRYGLPSEREDPQAAAKQHTLQERLQEVLGTERVAEQKREEQLRLEAERRAEARRRLDAERLRVQSLAVSMGISEQAAGTFFDRVNELQPAMDAKFKDLEKTLTGTHQERARQMQQAIRAELEAIAAETVGQESKALLDKLQKGDY